MQKIIFYTVVLFVTFISKVSAQEKDKEIIVNKKEKESFVKKVENISIKIEFIKFRIKDQLKDSLLVLDNKFKKGDINQEEYENLKIEKAQELADKMNVELDKEYDELNILVQQKVDGKFGSLNIKKDSVNFKGEYFTGYSAVTDSSDVLSKIVRNFKKRHKEKRTTSQFVFAAGLNNLITEGENFENSDYRVWGSHFYEWGTTYNTRIFKNNNLLHAKYGLSVMYNNLRPTENRYFVKNGDQTELQTGSIDFNESRFRNVYLVAPIHLEFDFTPKKFNKKGEAYYRTHESLRLGIGGYGGVRVKSKQILKYEIDDTRIKNKQKGDFNVSNYIYGLSAYIGYKETSLYVKYDLNPMFKNNTVEQNNISLGVRFDFN